MDIRHVIEIKEALAAQRTLLASIKEDVEGIREQLIPDGVKRVVELEDDVKSLNRYKNILIGMVTFVTSIPVIKAAVGLFQ